MYKIDIRRAAKERGLTLVQVAQNAGISPQAMQSIASGNPTVNKLYSIAEAIGCNIVDLFYPTEEELAAKAQESADTQTTDAPQLSSSPASADPSPLISAPQVHFCPHCGTKFQILL